MKFSRRLQSLLIILFWLIVWQAAAGLINQRLLLVSPIDTVKALERLVPTRAFWHRIGFSAGRILTGFSLALLAGCLFAILAHTNQLLHELLAPVMQLVKATPVASFIILALLWIRSKNLSILISFLMVLPVVYSAILEGLSNLDRQLGEIPHSTGAADALHLAAADLALPDAELSCRFGYLLEKRGCRRGDWPAFRQPGRCAVSGENLLADG